MKQEDLTSAIEEIKRILSRPLVNSFDIQEAKERLSEIQNIELNLNK